MDAIGLPYSFFLIGMQYAYKNDERDAVGLQPAKPLRQLPLEVDQTGLSIDPEK